jgi:hypothetical protein
MDTSIGLDVVIHGATSPLGTALVERLLTSTKTIFVEEKEFHRLHEKIAPTTSLHGCSIALAVGDEDCRKIEFTTDEDFSEDFDITVSPNGNDTFRQSGTHVIIYDLLLPQRKEMWASSEIHDCIEILLQGGEPTLASQPRHWLSHRDAASGIFDLLRCEKLPDGIIPMCGRKAWSASATIEQLKLLLQRSLSASTQSFTASDLAADSSLGTPGTDPFASKSTTTPAATSAGSAISEGGGPSPNRPNLAPLHSALLKLQPEGWRTMTPLRVGLMEVIANHLEVDVD